jgi:hypothetical protein
MSSTVLVFIRCRDSDWNLELFNAKMVKILLRTISRATTILYKACGVHGLKPGPKGPRRPAGQPPLWPLNPTSARIWTKLGGDVLEAMWRNIPILD